MIYLLAMIDLRSDTVTKPNKDMRNFMSCAEVGDDVYGEDITINTLQKEAAEAFGFEDGLFVPSGSMSNQIAIQTHCQLGDQAFCGRGAHTLIHETGAAAAYAGVQLSQIGESGIFTAADLENEFHDEADDHHTPQKLVLIENTHNGQIWPMDIQSDVLMLAKKNQMFVHIDGARIWNAAVASDCSLKTITNGADSVSVCLSKGLGAPVGSVLLGDRLFIKRARKIRKRMGGGMRQAGIIAAGGLYALRRFIENSGEHIQKDHERAKRLADELSVLPKVEIAIPTQTNMVFLKLQGELSSKAVIKEAKEKGILFGENGKNRIRLVTHIDLTDEDIVKTIQILKQILS